ncbi:MAG: hypothetical protein QM757_38420 [Paludibaculum sp.]
MRCSSSLVPRVVLTRAWVSPRVKRAEPCTRGRTPTSMEMLRISSMARRSGRWRSSSISWRKIFSRSSSKQIFASLFSASSSKRAAASTARSWIFE